MNFNFNMPARIICGEECVLNNEELFAIGKNAIIVTGAASAIKSGALDDVVSVLSNIGIDYIIYDKVRENPLLSTVYEAGQIARAYGCDFVIGIGGGSPMDSAKAIAAFAANPDISPDEIFDTSKLNKSLPIILIPTTSGTGSEANPYSILTLDSEDKKKTFNSPYSYPTYAFLDYRYTTSMGKEGTLSCALDAFCHCIESFLSPKSNEISRMYALWGGKYIWKNFDSITEEKLTDKQREELLYASFCGGMAINITGTGFPHPMGYNLTFEFNIPHGKACAVFTGKFIEYQQKNTEGAKRLREFADYIGADTDEIKNKIPMLSGVKEVLDKDTTEKFYSKISSAGNFANACYVIGKDEIFDIYGELFK